MGTKRARTQKKLAIVDMLNVDKGELIPEDQIAIAEHIYSLAETLTINKGEPMSEEQTVMEKHIHVLSTGVRVRLGTVSLAAITDAQKRIQQPPVPKSVNKKTGQEEDDPQHPDYLAACERTNMERADSVMEALALFAVDLVDGLPKDDKWLRKLKLLDRRGRLDLAGYDLEDEVDLEFLFTKYVALSLPDWTQLFKSAGIEEGAVSEMMTAFGEGIDP